MALIRDAVYARAAGNKPEDFAEEALLGQILQQLRLMNLYLSMSTGETLTAVDLEDE